MKNIIRRIIVGIIIGLVLMCARKYLFVSANAATISSKPVLNQFIYYRGNGTGYAANSQDGLTASLSASTIGENSYDGNFSWTFRMPQNVNVPKNSHILFDIAVEMSYPTPGATTINNDKYAIGTNGNMYGGGNMYACDVSVQMFDVNSQVTYNPYYGVFVETDGVSSGGHIFSIVNSSQNLKAVYSFDCFIDDSITLTMSNGNVVFNTPPMSIPYYWWSYGSRGYSSIMITQDSSTMINNSINNASQAVSDSIDNVNNTLSDSSTDDPDNAIDDMSDSVATNGTISQLLTLPIQLYQNILNSVSGSCSSFNLGNLLGTTLLLPCINLQNLLGSTLYGVIDILCSGLFILSFRKKMVDIFNHMTSLNDRGNELE